MLNSNFANSAPCRNPASMPLMSAKREKQIRAVGAWMREMTRKHHISASAWADAAGVAVTTVTRHVKNHPIEKLSLPKHSTLMMLAEELGETVPDFTTWTPSQESDLNTNAASESAFMSALSSSGKFDSPNATLATTVPVVGNAEAGVWRKVGELKKVLEYIPFPAMRDISDVQALAVRGDVADLRYPEGTRVAFVKLGSIPLRNGANLIIETIAGEMVETTIRRLRVTRQGWELHSLSSDPDHKAVLKAEDRQGFARKGITIAGIVIGAYVPDVANGEIIDQGEDR